MHMEARRDTIQTKGTVVAYDDLKLLMLHYLAHGEVVFTTSVTKNHCGYLHETVQNFSPNDTANY